MPVFCQPRPKYRDALRSHIIGDENPARSSPAYGSLFPAGVAAAQMREPGDAARLLPAEARHLGRAVPKRIQEFAAGRLCARRALAELGIVDFPLAVAADRQPVWPPSVVGSITHTSGFCAAVAAHRSDFLALGIDTERAGRVKRALWPKICTASELAWLTALPPDQSAAGATLIFCAKEAFYKCQYALTGEFLGFHDAEIAAPRPGAEAGGIALGALSLGALSLGATRKLAVERHVALPLSGRFACHEGFISVGFAVANSARACG